MAVKNGMTGKRIAVLLALLLITLTLVLSACTSPVTAPLPKVTYQGTLVVWAAPGLAGYPASGPQIAWFEERARAYEASHSGITVRVVNLNTPEALEKALLEPASGGRPAPDLAFGRFLPELAPRLADLSVALKPEMANAYLPNARAAFSKDGVLHGLPTLLEVQVLALNEACFAATGATLPENGRWNLAQFESALQKLSQNGHFGLGFYQLPRYHEYWPLLSGLLRQDGNIADGAADGLTRLQYYRKHGWLYPDSGKVKAEDIWVGFAKGEIAVLPISAWAVPLLRSEPYNAKFAVAKFPDGLTTGYTYGISLFRQEETAKLQAALDLAQFMATTDQQVRLARETGLMPALTPAGNPFEGDSQMTRAYEAAAGQQSLPAGPAWDAAEASLHKPLLYALLGSQEPRVSLDEIGKAIQSATALPSR